MNPFLWIGAAYLLKEWLQADRDWSFLDEGSTEHGFEKQENVSLTAG